MSAVEDVDKPSARGPMRRRLSGMPLQFSPLAKKAVEEVNHFEVDAILAQFPTPPDTIPPPPTAKDAMTHVISGVSSTASKGLGLVSRLWGGAGGTNPSSGGAPRWRSRQMYFILVYDGPHGLLLISTINSCFTDTAHTI